MSNDTSIREYCAVTDRSKQTIPYLNEMIESGHVSDLILVTEARQERQLAHIADDIAAHEGIKVVLIAGPSSSGKTSTSKRLCIQLMACHKHPVALSMDNWFVNRDQTPLDENGKKDYESIYAMDLKQFNEDLQNLIDGNEVALPTFNFQLGEREYHGEKLTMSDDMILVIEGIHALNPLMTEQIPAENKFKIFAAPMTPISMDGQHWIPTSATRLLRRITRDYQTRGLSAQRTIEMWDSVRRGEEKWILPFQKEADAVFDSTIIYELAALKPKAEEVLRQVPAEAKEHEIAVQLLTFLSCFEVIESTEIPRASLLREFIGGSFFDVG